MDQEAFEQLEIHLNIVEIGYIDLLVEQGIYLDRDAFIIDSIKSKIEENQAIINQTIKRKSHLSNFTIGIKVLTQTELMSLRSTRNQSDLLVIGMLIIPSTIDDSDIFRRFRSIKVYGAVQCSDSVRSFYSL